MNTLIDTIINATITIGTVGGFGFIYINVRDYYFERKWAKQWDMENRDWDTISMEEIKRILDRTDD